MLVWPGANSEKGLAPGLFAYMLFEMKRSALLFTLFLLVGTFGAGVTMVSAAACVPVGGTINCAAAAVVETFSAPPPRANSILTGVTYGWVEDYSRFYEAPQPGARRVHTSAPGFTYGPVEDRTTDLDGAEWLKVWGNWLPARYYHEVEASAFTGVLVNATPRRPFGWMLREYEVRAEPGAEAVAGAPTLQRYDFVQVYERAMGSDGAIWYDVGENEWVRYHTVALLTVREQPRGLEAHEFWVDVDLTQQVFAAYEGERMVFAGLIASGLPRWATRRGLFRVWRTDLTTPMAGGVVGDDYYYLEEVPHNLFFDGAIALHGAYWHDDFGRPKSHGCVNIAPRAAEWLFFWSLGAPGDLRVWVHTSHHSEFVVG